MQIFFLLEQNLNLSLFPCRGYGNNTQLFIIPILTRKAFFNLALNIIMSN